MAIEPAGSGNTRPPATLTAADLAEVPIDWLEQLHQAATKVNAKLVLDLIEQIRQPAPH